MLRSKKNRSIVSILQDRELNINCPPYFSSVSAVSCILRSNNSSLYENYWKTCSPKQISYDSGYLYFSGFTRYCSIYGKNAKTPPTFPPTLFQLQKTKAKKKVLDVIYYSTPVYRNFEDFCKCMPEACTCLSQYLLTFSEDNWMCQHLMSSGKLIRQYYIRRLGQKLRVHGCNWDVYGERFIVYYDMNPRTALKNPDVVDNLAVFTAFPLEFLVLLEIKHSVFGENCTSANVSDQHLFVSLSEFRVHIYNFEDFLKEGELYPLRLGQKYGDAGRVGHYPLGLPLNFTYSSAPPVLFDVRCQGGGPQLVRFGGFPYHYISSTSGVSSRPESISVTRVETNARAEGGTFAARHRHDAALRFHPDRSNRLLFRSDHAVDCYRLLSSVDGTSRLDRQFTMRFGGAAAAAPEHEHHQLRGRGAEQQGGGRSMTVHGSCYDVDLDLFAVMGVHRDGDSTGHVLLFDSRTGREVRSVRLRQKVCSSDNHAYQLHMHLGSIVLIEHEKQSYHFAVHVYNL